MRTPQHRIAEVRKRLLGAATAGLTIVIVHFQSANAAKPSTESELPPPAARPVDWTQDIQPLFESRCYPCHGPENQESGLRLDDAEQALKGGDLGKAYIPGESSESPLVHYIAGTDEHIVMPPAD